MDGLAKELFGYMCQLAYMLAVFVRDFVTWIDQKLVYLVTKLGDFLAARQNARIVIFALYAFLVWKLWKWYKKYPKEETESQPELEKLLKKEKKTTVNKKKKGSLDASIIFILLIIVGILVLAYLAQKNGAITGDNLLFPKEFVE